MSVPEQVRRYMSKLGKKGGKNRLKNHTKAERSEIMKRVRAAGVAKQQERKANNGG